MEDLINKVNEVLVEEFEIDAAAIKPTANFKETLDLDSLDYVDLVVAIDTVSGVKLVENDFKSIISFQDFYTLLQNKINKELI